MNMPVFDVPQFRDKLSTLISERSGETFIVNDYKALSGGDIHQSYCIDGSDKRYFVKVNSKNNIALLNAEVLSLRAIVDNSGVLTPKVIYCGLCQGSGILVLEFFDIFAMDHYDAFAFGQALAAMHQNPGEDAYGFEQDNFIGVNPQINDWQSAWADFFAEQRIGVQLNLANRDQVHFAKVDEIIAASRLLLLNHQPKPSLLHGDLWHGNAGMTEKGPLLYDPACYWGDRECDIAMSELFGGFSQEFYRGYDAVFPLEKGYQQRKKLYNLYHILNHANTFGGAYYSQAKTIINELFAQAAAS